VVHDDDLVIAVCDNAYEDLNPRPSLHWSIPDPVQVGTDAAFEAAYTDLAGRINRFSSWCPTSCRCWPNALPGNACTPGSNPI